MFGVVAAALTGGDRWGGGGDGGRRGGAGFLFVLVAVAIGATVFAYRRLARPVSSLLESADRIGGGDYSTRVEPSGPRSVRTLGSAFNEMAERLDAGEESRRRFMADVAHELRTPLTVLQGGIEAQLDGVHPRDDGHLETLLDQAHTMGRLVEDLRVLALSDAGRLTITPEPLALDEVVGDAAAAIRPLADRRAIALEVDAPEPIGYLGDSVRLGQVLVNLLSNAVRHSPPGGRVTVTLVSVDGAPAIVVADTGPGISGDPERLFDRFSRAADSGGMGLGLTIARQLVQAHGGTLTAANRGGGGAALTVRLPAA